MLRAAVLAESRGHVCYRYRWQAYAPALAEAGWLLEPQVLARGWRSRLGQFARLRSADLVVLQRKLLPAWQLRRLRRAAARLVFDFDDAVFSRDSYARKGLHSRRRERRFRAVVRMADLVIAGNRFLAAAASRAGARTLRVIPTAVNPALYERVEGPGTRVEERRSPPTPKRPSSDGRSQPSCARPLLRPAGRPSALTQLVWIGSRSTRRSLDRARELLQAIAASVANLSLRVICDTAPRIDGLNVVFRPWSAETEAAELAAGDIGISWMPDDDWSRGKCGLKVLQYMAAGLPVVANPVGVHAEMVRGGETGFLADGPAEWVEAIRRLSADPELRRRMGAAGRRRVEEHYSTRRWAGVLTDCLQACGPRTSGYGLQEIAPVPCRLKPEA